MNSMNDLQVLQQYWWVFPVLVLDLVLKGLALYKSARVGQKGWFIALFIINTAGILPAVYLLINKGKK